METNLCVAGFGGQGVMTLGKFLATATCDSTDKNVTFFQSANTNWRQIYLQILKKKLTFASETQVILIIALQKHHSW